MKSASRFTSERISFDLFDVGFSPVANGADFACSWTGPHPGQLIIRSGMLHINADGRSETVPRERIAGWTIRPLGDTALLTIGEPEPLSIALPNGLTFAVERALGRLQQRGNG